MKRLAIFVEGQTEQIFITRLLIEIAGKHNLDIVKQKAVKSKKGNRYFSTIDAQTSDSVQKYYILIRDCGGDHLVKSDILESYESLANKNYEKIIGIRDVYPVQSNEIPKLIRGMSYGMPSGRVPVNILLAIMEIESWFIAEGTHFCRLDETLTKEHIETSLFIDISPENVENLSEPAKCLNEIYKLAGQAYNKKRANVQRTVDLIDYARLYIEVPHKVGSLKRLIDELHSFI